MTGFDGECNSLLHMFKINKKDTKAMSADAILVCLLLT